MHIEIDAKELKGMRQDVLLVDCRRKEEWDICKIDGAVLYPLAEFSQHLPVIRSQAKDRQVVVYCHTGRRSLVAAHLLQKEGIKALSLRGGIEAWADIDDSVARY